MKGISTLFWVALIALPILAVVGDSDASYGDDNDFAEFEDFDADDDFVQVTTQKQDSESVKRAEGKQGGQRVANERNDDFAEIYENDDADDADGIVEEEDSEFEHFTDEEEFEGFNKAETTPPNVDQTTGEPKLTMAKVPLHFRCVSLPHPGRKTFCMSECLYNCYSNFAQNSLGLILDGNAGNRWPVNVLCKLFRRKE